LFTFTSIYCYEIRAKQHLFELKRLVWPLSLGHKEEERKQCLRLVECGVGDLITKGREKKLYIIQNKFHAIFF